LAACGPAWPTIPSTPSSAAALAPVALVVEPDAGPQAVLDLVSSARASLWMEMYLLTDDGAIAALAGRAAAGCDVRVILEPAPTSAGRCHASPIHTPRRSSSIARAWWC
jgi:phosphatidylserine/phosphatidylglycerophosphate/cardiolipin synthase-like enzyme